MIEAGVRAGAEIFDKLDLEPHKNGPAPQHWLRPTLPGNILGDTFLLVLRVTDLLPLTCPKTSFTKFLGSFRNAC
jgi:hypothetical protein